jgi:hypothetical protein
VTFLAPEGAPLLGPLMWLVWFFVLWRTRARNMPLPLHVGIAVLWVVAGCIPLGISV